MRGRFLSACRRVLASIILTAAGCPLGESPCPSKHLFLEANIFTVKARVLMMEGIKKESSPHPPWLHQWR